MTAKRIDSVGGCANANYLPATAIAVADLRAAIDAMARRPDVTTSGMIAAGHYAFALYSKLMPWDHAAGWLLHREAGGYAARLDASPYDLTRHTGGLLCTPDRASWQDVRGALVGD